MTHEEPPGLPPIPVPAGVHDHAAQRAWERYSVERGIARYHARQRSAAGDMKALKDQSSGHDFAALLLPRLADRILTYQVGIALAIAEEEVHAHDLQDHEFIAATVAAETLAVVTVLSVLGATTGEEPLYGATAEPGDIGFTGLAVRVGNAVQRELDAAAWKAAEAAAAKQRKATGMQPLTNLYGLMRKRNASIDRRVFQKWSKKAPLFQRQTWDEGTALTVGSNLLALLIQSCPDYFCAAMSKGTGKWRRILRFTPAAWAFMADRDAHRELARPFYLPMICEPLDHAYPPEDGANTPDISP